MIDVEDDVETQEGNEFPGENYQEEMEMDAPQISVTPLTGFQGFQPTRVTGVMNKKVLHILIDFGSTHNSLNDGTARRMGCQMVPIKSVQVAAANGSALICSLVFLAFKWRMHGLEFTVDVLIIPLENYDMVLGI